jgi:RHS repeat-associated protein
MVVDTHTGTVMQRTDYDEFGLIIDEDLAEGFQPVIFGYAGGLQDRDTGLIRFGARDYDPMVGRWTSKEPLGFNGSSNFYVYADNDPVNKVDVTGLKPGDVFYHMDALIADVEKYTMNLKDADIYEHMAEIYVHSRTKTGSPCYAYRDPYHTKDSHHVSMRGNYETTGVVAVWHSHIVNPLLDIYGSSELSGLKQYNQYGYAPSNTDIGVALLLQKANNGFGAIFMTLYDVSYGPDKKPAFDILGHQKWGTVE